MKIKLIVIAFVVLSTGLSAQKHDFRQSFWGDSYEKVKSIEKDSIIKETPDLLLYSSKVCPGRLQTAYTFKDGKLIQCSNSYICSNSKDFFLKYDSIKSDLCILYGKPDKYVEMWEDGMKDIYDAPAKPIEYLVNQGILSIMVEWFYGKNEITLLYYLKDNRLNLGLMYNKKPIKLRHHAK